MGTVGIIVDSSCGLSKKEAENKGLYYAPIVINFNGKDMKSGIDINTEFLYQNMDLNTKIKTSAVPMALMSKLYEKASKDNDSVIVITISKYISSGNDNAKVIAKNFKNVTVFDSKFITPWIEHIIDTIIELASQGKEKEILQLLEKQNKVMWGILAPNSLEYLHAGGRISKSQYIMGNLLKIIPLIPVKNGALNNTGVLKARTEKKAAKKMADELDVYYNDLIASGIKKEDIDVATIEINSKKFHKEIIAALDKKGYKNCSSGYISPEILAHTGPEIAGCGLRMKNPDFKKDIKKRN